MADEPLTEELSNAVTILADELRSRGAQYALIGGIAAGFRGRARFTDDVDVLLTIPQIQLPGLLEALQSRGFSFDLFSTIREWNQHNLVVLQFRGVRVDWMRPAIPLYQHVLDRAVAEQWHGREIRIASAEGLIVLKLIAARSQDWSDIESILVANRGRLDMSWIEQEWCTLFETSDSRWKRFLETVRDYYEPRSA